MIIHKRDYLIIVWKSDQKAKRTQKNLKLALVALLVLGLLLLFGRVFQFFSEFQKPFYSLNSQQREHFWDGKSTFNVVVAQVEKGVSGTDLKNLSFVSLNPLEEKLTILKLSDDIYLEVPKNYGSWKLSSVYKLGQEENPQIGEGLVKMSVSKMLALPVDGIIEISSDKELVVEEQINNWKKNILSGFSFLTVIKTDLSLNESMDFMMKASKIRSDKITSVDLFRSTITQSKLLPDSSRVLGVDGIKLDTFIKESLFDPQISSEDLTVAVFNGTDHPGLTAETVRLVNNLGARVTIITNTSEKFVQNGIYINSQEGENIELSESYKRLAEIYAPDCLKEECMTLDTEVKNSRAAINIVLGEEYFKHWYSR